MRKVITFARHGYEKVKGIAPLLKTSISDLKMVADSVLPEKYRNRLDEFSQVLEDINSKIQLTDEQKELFDNIITSISETELFKNLTDEQVIPGTKITKGHLLEEEQVIVGTREFSWDIVKESVLPLTGTMNIAGNKVPTIIVQTAIFVVLIILMIYFMGISDKYAVIYSAVGAIGVTFGLLYFRKDIGI